jgi:hypothetical protein
VALTQRALTKGTSTKGTSTKGTSIGRVSTQRRGLRVTTVLGGALAATLLSAPASQADAVKPPSGKDLPPQDKDVELVDIGPGQKIGIAADGQLRQDDPAANAGRTTWKLEKYLSGSRVKTVGGPFEQCLTNDNGIAAARPCKGDGDPTGGNQTFAFEPVKTRKGKTAFRIRNDISYLKADFVPVGGPVLSFGHIPPDQASAYEIRKPGK